mgnify:CR=1 FL=1
MNLKNIKVYNYRYFKETDEVLTELEAIGGTTDMDIAAASTSLDSEKILGGNIICA